ncbi:GNAT family N-acetyltransferase [Pseudotamlana carrageenivorans]|uniref:N-acetyltransferase domain-containing protein n=1 Tax=Pseudotamlana carrageenivorans TaxID=2069432 RepID=A0A2I7SH33_9FLAO|nr:GNAT family protein [Tamlana carrageenivorans]AUS05209.1 hypothetical protein C1A40_06870 [Tamlana carrageenivorans]
MRAVVLESERLILKPLSLLHLSMTYVNWMNDIDVYRYLETGGNYTIDDLANYLKEQEDKDILFWAIHLKHSDKHIGNIKIDPIDKNKKSGEYGIMMGDKTEWGKGYALDASKLVLNYCLTELKLCQITLGVVENNLSAIKLYGKLGFKLEKVVKSSGVYGGELCNSVRMVKKNE